jgi:hypothetical protein
MDINLTKFETILAIGTFVWAISSFLISRKKELSWKKTEFIVQQSEIMDSTKEMQEVTLILYGKHSQKSVSDFIKLTSKAKLDKNEEDYLMQFESYLNFLWRISYSYLVLKTLSKKDMNAFGAYFKAVNLNKELKEYCLKEGYDEIVTAYNKFYM